MLAALALEPTWLFSQGGPFLPSQPANRGRPREERQHDHVHIEMEQVPSLREKKGTQEGI